MRIFRHRDLWLMGTSVTAAATGLGYWLFGAPGIALWVLVSLFFTVVLYHLHRYSPLLAMAIPLLVAAIALYEASTLGWGSADSPDGTRFKASPVGLSQVLSPHQTVSATVDCRWHPPRGDAELCAVAPGGEAAYRQLLAVYPILWVSIVLCLVGSAAPFRKHWRLKFANRVIALMAATLAFLALWLFSHALGRALTALSHLEVGTGGSLGTMEMTAAILLCFLAGVLPPTDEIIPAQHYVAETVAN